MSATRSVLLLLFSILLLFTVFYWGSPFLHHSLFHQTPTVAPSSIRQFPPTIIYETQTLPSAAQDESGEIVEETPSAVVTGSGEGFIRERVNTNLGSESLNAHYSDDILENAPVTESENSVGWLIEEENLAPKSLNAYYADELLEEAVDERDVVVLGGKNFSRFIRDNRHVMVEFYAPWCYWSKKLVPEYAKAATALKGTAAVSKVDCVEESKLAMKYRIQGYPSLFFFIGGVHMDAYTYYGERTRDAMAAWVKQHMAITIHNVTTNREAEMTFADKSVKVLGFFDTLESGESEELAAASKLHKDVNFYRMSTADVAEISHIDPTVKRPALFMVKKDSQTYIPYDGPFTRSAISDFVSMNKPSSENTISLQNVPLFFEIPVKQLWLFAHSKNSDNVISTFQEAAKAFHGQLIFVHIEMGSESFGKQLSYEFGVAGDDPKVVGYTGSGDAKKHVLDGELTLASIKLFAEDFLADNIYKPLRAVFKE